MFQGPKVGANNLKLNREKSKEIIFTDNRKKCNATPPFPIHGIARVTFLKILGVTIITNTLSASNHIREAITHCAQTLHALRVLRCNGLPGDALQTVYRATVVAKLLYACCAWSSPDDDEFNLGKIRIKAKLQYMSSIHIGTLTYKNPLV